jgi:hypothetical protein
MKLNAPKQITYWIAVILAVLGIIAKLVTIPFLTGIAGWIVIVAFILLALGNVVKGL